MARQLTKRLKSPVCFRVLQTANGLVNVDGPQTIPKSLHPNRTSIPQTSTDCSSLSPTRTTTPSNRRGIRCNHRLINNQARNTDSRIHIPRPFRSPSSSPRETTQTKRTQTRHHRCRCPAPRTIQSPGSLSNSREKTERVFNVYGMYRPTIGEWNL